MKNFKKTIALVSVMAMAGSMLAGCGGGGDTATTTAGGGDAATTTKAAETTKGGDATVDAPAAGEGDTLKVYCWNDEFKRRVTDHMPGYDAATDTIDGVKVEWIITPNDNNAYQNKLDEDLLNGVDIDMFLIEADYALKYVDTDYAMPVKDLGITDADLADQYQYTKDIVTDGNGVLRGLSWQGCPGVLVYNREAAKAILGSDDPAEVQKAVKDWDTFNATAALAKDAGYYMVSGYDDTYRVFSNNVSTKWVVDGKIVIDENIMNWVDQAKEFTDKGYNNKSSLWDNTWNQGFFPDGKVFCYFGPAWLIDFCMAANLEGSIANQGGWGATEGPQGFFWGGTWVCGASTTDNPTLVGKIMKTMTTDPAVLEDIVRKDNDFTNSKTVMEKMAADTSYSSKVLGGQNALGMFCAGAEKIDMSTISPYDQGCTEEFQKAMKDYFDGVVDKDTALQNFYKAVTVKYPELTY